MQQRDLKQKQMVSQIASEHRRNRNWWWMVKWERSSPAEFFHVFSISLRNSGSPLNIWEYLCFSRSSLAKHCSHWDSMKACKVFDLYSKTDRTSQAKLLHIFSINLRNSGSLLTQAFDSFSKTENQRFSKLSKSIWETTAAAWIFQCGSQGAPSWQNIFHIECKEFDSYFETENQPSKAFPCFLI